MDQHPPPRWDPPSAWDPPTAWTRPVEPQAAPSPGPAQPASPPAYGWPAPAASELPVWYPPPPSDPPGSWMRWVFRRGCSPGCWSALMPRARKRSRRPNGSNASTSSALPV